MRQLSVFLIFIFFGCGSLQQKEKSMVFEKYPPFVITEARFQQVQTQVPQNPEFKLFIAFDDLDSDVEIQAVYFRDRVATLKNSPNRPNFYTAEISDRKPEIVMHRNPIQETANTFPAQSEFQLKENEAVLRYQYKNELFYFNIRNMIENRF